MFCKFHRHAWSQKKIKVNVHWHDNSTRTNFIMLLLTMLTKTTCDGISLINCLGADLLSDPVILLVKDLVVKRKFE